MIELKSKKSGITHIISDEEYASMVKKGAIQMSRFTVTKLQMRSIIPSFPKETKINKVPIVVPTPEVKETKKQTDEG